MNSDSAQQQRTAVDTAAAAVAARSVGRPAVDMPDVVRPAPASSVRGAAEAASHAASSPYQHVCRAACRHQAPVNNPSSAAAAAAARYEVVYADNAASLQRQPGVMEPLPDLVNVHRPPPYDDQAPASSTCHAPVNHYVPQPAPSAAPVHSPTHCSVRRVRAWSKLGCCEEHSVASCMLSTAALKWSILILVSLGFACIVIGVILAVLQITAGVQHSSNSLVHSAVLMVLGAALVAVVAVIWKCVLGSSSDGRSRSEPTCRRLLVQLSERVSHPGPRSAGPRSAGPRSAGPVPAQWTAGRRPACTAAYRHCDYTYWSPGVDNPEIHQQQQRQPPPSYALHNCESTHGTCQLAGQHCADSASPPLVERAACARRLCVATLPGRSTCRLYVAGESVQCRMVPCSEMCRHNCYDGSLQR